MKNIFLLITISCLAVKTIGQTNNPELDKMLAWVYADSKEEVVLTKDIGEGIKIWSLADGKLLFNYAKGDASALGKILRYGIQDDEFLRRNLDCKLSFDGAFSIYHYYYEKTFFKGIIVPTNSNSFTNRHQKTKQVAYTTYKDGATYYYGVNAPDDATQCSACTFEEIAKIKNGGKQYYGIDFSPSGKYIYSIKSYSEAVCMIDVEKKEVLWKNKNWKDMHSFGESFVFNKDETQCATLYDNGMLILDVQTGNILDSILLPERFKGFKNGKIFPCSDMKSFVFIQYCNKYEKDIANCSANGWLIKKNEVIELAGK